MCGIVGVLDTIGKREVSRPLIERMNESQHHRGPDEGGVHLEPGLGLGHRRLSIIDLSTGQQPLYNEDGSVCVVFNGEIYNYQALIPELTRLGHIFRTKSDTEVIVHAWEAWGPDCVKRFRGMFAFALWDRNQDTLFLARDRFGVKPLYYALLDDGTFIFGSELKALLAHRGLARTVDPYAVEEYFRARVRAGTAHDLHHGEEAPTGAHAELRRGRPFPSRPSTGTCGSRSTARSTRSEACEELVARLRESVELRLISEVPLGAFLSGGVDSSAVVATMAGLAARPGQHVLDRVQRSRVRRVEVRADGRRPLPHPPLRRSRRE